MNYEEVRTGSTVGTNSPSFWTAGCADPQASCLLLHVTPGIARNRVFLFPHHLSRTMLREPDQCMLQQQRKALAENGIGCLEGVAEVPEQC